MDVMKLMMSGVDVELIGDSMVDFYVRLHGPKDTPYEKGVWKLRVMLPKQYPYKSPSIGFQNRIFHPNVDDSSGSVCLDVINQTWSPMFDLVNVFNTFLPQLLTYPNPTDPLNSVAATLLLRDPDRYKERVREWVTKYATPEKVKIRPSVSSQSIASQGGKSEAVSDVEDDMESLPSHDSLDLDDL